jgi:hypothetical protein
MNRGGQIVDIVDAVGGLVELFSRTCIDKETLGELSLMAADRSHWHRGHALFQRIRSKTILAEKSKDSARSAQYLFEEACAKTFYNLSGQPAPFDADSPYWIVPNAIALARRLGMPEASVLRVVAP